jgi:hypothetical protein
MPEPNSVDAIVRQTASQTSQANAVVENTTNLATNSSLNTALDTVVAALPAPLPVAVQTLSTAIYAALKVPMTPVLQPVPTPTSDPIKAFALMIAFAIIQALWCFIKSLLNPLPIIGPFFPLCPPENIDNADNQKLNQSQNQFNDLQQPEPTFNPQSIPQATAPQQSQDDQGITFGQYLRNNGISEDGQVGKAPYIPPPPRIPEPPPQDDRREPDWQRGEQTFDSIRRRFGL